MSAIGIERESTMNTKLKLAVIVIGLLVIGFAMLQVANNSVVSQQRFDIAGRCRQQAIEQATHETFDNFVEQCKIEGGYYR